MPRHKVLILGVGSIGERHLRCFQATKRAECSLVEIDETLRQNVAQRYGVRHAFADLDAALAERPDVAVIAVPAPLHVPFSLRLAEAGVHLLIEKPLGTTLDGIDRLRQIVQERRLTAATAYVYRCNPLLAAMRQAIVSGRFGAPVEVTAVCGQHFPTYRPAYRNIYYADRTTGGGAIQDALTHVLNAGEWLVGPVTRLVADAAHQILEDVTVEDTAHVLTRHGSVLGCYSLNQHQAPNEIILTVACERGTARFESHENRWRWMIAPGDDWHDERPPLLERDALFVAQANALLDAVEGKAPPPCSLDDGVQTLLVNLAALASVEHGVWQAIERGNR